MSVVTIGGIGFVPLKALLLEGRVENPDERF